MTVYIDSSVLLRIVMDEPNALVEWATIRRAVSSSLLRTECLRTLDRLRLRLNLPDHETSRRRAAILAALDVIELVEIDDAVLERAAQPMPTLLKTLDAIHLATALLWKDFSGVTPIFATHDQALGIAAVAHGFRVVGV